MSEDFIFLIHPLKENDFDVFITARFQEVEGESTPQIRYFKFYLCCENEGRKHMIP